MILTLPVLILSGVSYYTAGGSIEDEIMRSARNSVDQLNEMIDQNIEKKRMLLHISVKRSKKNIQGKGQTSLRQSLNNTPGKQRCRSRFTGSEDGVYVQHPYTKCLTAIIRRKGPGLKKRLRKRRNYRYRSIHICRYRQHGHYHRQTNKDGSGVAALSLNIDELIKATNDIKVGKDGFAFISSASKNISPTRRLKPELKVKAAGLIKFTAKERRIQVYFEGKPSKWLLRQTN
ncbi:hypothetical protein PO124_35220 [Bacillus licheniformis]|nr:hypothetical protein [Bacillus licheniformis]